MKTVIKNIAELIQTEDSPRKWVAGKNMAKINTIKDAFVEVENGIITLFGSMEDWAGIEDWNNTEIIDAEGGMVFPTYCDSHTHLVFAASREGEFVDRINGLSYAEIAEKGGGILNSAQKLQNASEDELYEEALVRLNELVKMGTGAIEIKSGYGLTLDSEIKMLRVIKRLKENTEVTIKATFLGAHALPKEFKDNKEGYMDLVINEMLPKVAAEKLADYVDIFCEKGYFTVDDTQRLLKAANELGIPSKTHVNHFCPIVNSIINSKSNIFVVLIAVRGVSDRHYFYVISSAFYP
jgi:imidazolonepropionase